MIKRFPRNTVGRDFIVGDIHGCYHMLDDEMKRIGFNPLTDRMFSVGDLVDRGPQSAEALLMLKEDYFHAVMGNHEMMLMQFAAGDIDVGMYVYNGGRWATLLPKEDLDEFVRVFMALPLAIELETSSGLLGIVHATCDYSSWDEFKAAVDSDDYDTRRGAMMNAVWGRTRVNKVIRSHQPVAGVRAVVVGHTPTKGIRVVDNVHHIDTGACFMTGYLTVIDAETLLPAQPLKGQL